MQEAGECRKIAFVGTSCNGKTTLLEIYKQRFRDNPRFAFVEEAARDFFERNPSITDRFSAETQGKIQALVQQKEQEAHTSGAEIIFCDRSVLDAVAYVWSQGDREGANELFRRVRSWLSTYYKFLLLDPDDVEYKTDNIRQEDVQTRQQFHDAFVEFFEEARIPYELLSGTVEARIRRIDELLALENR